MAGPFCAQLRHSGWLQKQTLLPSPHNVAVAPIVILNSAVYDLAKVGQTIDQKPFECARITSI